MPKIERESYENFVEHPRYGCQPRITGLNPQTDFDSRTFLHWHSPENCRIPHTAISADLNKQTPATVAVTYYYDVERKCRDCQRMFIFFAAEQKYWYENLQFPLESDCIRCYPCREKQRKIASCRQQYESLCHQSERTAEQTLTTIECCLYLIENNIFKSIPHQGQRIRTLLNKVSYNPKLQPRVEQIWQRLRKIESN